MSLNKQDGLYIKIRSIRFFVGTNTASVVLDIYENESTYQSNPSSIIASKYYSLPNDSILESDINEIVSLIENKLIQQSDFSEFSIV